MAGLASTFTFKPLPRNPQKPISLTYLDSKFYGVRLKRTISLPKSITLVRYTAISARQGGRGSFRRPQPDEDPALDISRIRSEKVRLIDEKQNMVGIVSKMEALQMAADAELNLVILSPDADPPVVRIMDFDKYRYEQQKKIKEQKKKNNANRMDVKELKMGYNIDVHDYSVRLRAAKKFLTDGDKVKVIVNLKGRQNQFRNNAIELIRRFQEDVGELAVEEAKNLSDRNMFIILIPNKAVMQKAEEQPKKKKSPPTEAPPTEVSATI